MLSNSKASVILSKQLVTHVGKLRSLSTPDPRLQAQVVNEISELKALDPGAIKRLRTSLSPPQQASSSARAVIRDIDSTVANAPHLFGPNPPLTAEYVLASVEEQLHKLVRTGVKCFVKVILCLSDCV